MKFWNKVCIAITMGLGTSVLYGADLLEVYQQAASSAPELKGYLTTSEASRAGVGASVGAAAPAVTVAGNAGVNKTTGQGYNGSSAVFTVTQPVFDVNAWANIGVSNQTAWAANATYHEQLQQFIFTVATDYFTICENTDNLNFSKANVAFLKQTLDQTRTKFSVGLATVADVKQSEADYDTAIADLIQNQNDLADSYETLAELTGKTYTDLASLSSSYPFVAPQPADIHYWEKQAKEYNWALQAQRYTTQSQYRSVIATAGNQLPTVSVVGTYGQYYNNAGANGLSALGLSENSEHTATIGLQLTWTLFQSGGLALSTLQAAKTYEQQEATEDQTYRDTVSQTRQDYLAVMSNLSLVNAYQQSVIASDAALKQNLEEYKVGTQTIVEVLNAVQTLYQAQQNLVQARYSYILSMLQLKMDAGQLSVDDIKAINQYLAA